MTHHRAHRCLPVSIMAVSVLALVVAIAVPTTADAAVHDQRAKSSGGLIRLEKSKKYGRILADRDGRTLYFLTATTGKSFACTGACASIWPPVLTKERPRAGKGVDSKLLGTVKRGSGRQVTYDGHRLYRYAGDVGPAQANGEGISDFGGTWFVLSAKGSAVKRAVSSSPTTSAGGYGNGY